MNPSNLYSIYMIYETIVTTKYLRNMRSFRAEEQGRRQGRYALTCVDDSDYSDSDSDSNNEASGYHNIFMDNLEYVNRADFTERIKGNRMYSQHFEENVIKTIKATNQESITLHVDAYIFVAVLNNLILLDYLMDMVFLSVSDVNELLCYVICYGHFDLFKLVYDKIVQNDNIIVLGREDWADNVLLKNVLETARVYNRYDVLDYINNIHYNHSSVLLIYLLSIVRLNLLCL